MKIKIRKDAKELYIKEHTNWDGSYSGVDKWEKVLQKIEGKIIEVDVEMLFKHEFNTKPIPGVTKYGIRIMEEYVDEVINDIRQGKARCDFCNEISNSIEICSKCGKRDFLEALFDVK